MGTLKNKIYENMTSKSKNGHFNKLDDIVNKQNNIYHSTVKVKPVDVKSKTCINFGVKNNEKDSKFKVGDHERIWKYKNIFAKDDVPI